MNQKQIVVEVGVHKSTISRESGRNRDRHGWHPRQAQGLRDQRRKKCVNAQRVSLLGWEEIEHNKRHNVLRWKVG